MNSISHSRAGLSRRGSRPPRRRAAYTLMEILAVLSIIAIMASITLPAMDGFFASQRLSAEANTFIQNVRMAQYLALETSVYHRLYFLPDGSGYQLSSYVQPSGWVQTTVIQNVTDALNPASTNWVDITGMGTVEIDTLVSFKPPAGVSMIFFRPDGLLVRTPEYEADPVPDCIASFSFGQRDLTVNVTPVGIRASEEFYEE